MSGKVPRSNPYAANPLETLKKAQVGRVTGEAPKFDTEELVGSRDAMFEYGIARVRLSQRPPLSEEGLARLAEMRRHEAMSWVINVFEGIGGKAPVPGEILDPIAQAVLGREQRVLPDLVARKTIPEIPHEGITKAVTALFNGGKKPKNKVWCRTFLSACAQAYFTKPPSGTSGTDEGVSPWMQGMITGKIPFHRMMNALDPFGLMSLSARMAFGSNLGTPQPVRMWRR